MTIDTMVLEQQLQDEKTGLRTNLQSIGTRASEAVDWRHRMRTHPAEMLGAAVVLGVVVGALTTRSAASTRGERQPVAGGGVNRHVSSTVAPEWSRLKAGLAGMVADRAIVVAQDFLDGAMRRMRT